MKSESTNICSGQRDFFTSRWALTASRVLQGNKQVSPHQKEVSRPSVCCVWRPCHQQSLSYLRPLASGGVLGSRRNHDACCQGSPRPCSCGPRMRRFFRGIVPRLPFSLPEGGEKTPQNKQKQSTVEKEESGEETTRCTM